MVRMIVAVCLATLSAACTQLPRAELQAYSASFQAAQTAAEPMISDYAVAERAQRLDALPREPGRPTADGFLPTFKVSDATARSSIELPPGAGAVDRAFRAIAGYNDILVALAENRNIEEARGQVQQIIGDLGAIAPPAGGAVPVAKTLADLAIGALTPAIEADNRAEFRRIVLDGYPHIVALIGVLRDYTPTQFSTTTRLLRERVRMDPPPPDRADMIARINAWHVAFADYVVLLDGMERSLGALRDAVLDPRSRPLLQRAGSGAGELRAYVEALRQSLAQVRATP